jgi:hypothetical protein
MVLDGEEPTEACQGFWLRGPIECGLCSCELYMEWLDRGNAMVTLRWGTGVAEKVCGDGEGKLRNQLDCAPDMERWCLLSNGLPEGVRVLRWQSKRQQPTGRRLLR